MEQTLSEQIREAFKQRVEPVRRSPLYNVGLAFVTIVMVLLPIVYFLIVVLAGYGVYYHATHNGSILSGGSGTRWRIVAYFGPIVVGSILVVFMAMPLVPRFRRRPKPLHVITQANEPLVHELVMHICQAVNAPKPREIHLVMEPNAYAGFRKGFLSFFGNDLVLAIGMPLVSSLTLRQLSGVIAHEMGHFSQGVGMRMHYIIETINNWFGRAICGGSVLEEKLEEMTTGVGGTVGLVTFFSQLFILVTKGILWVCMMLGYLVSNFFSRQMEYDADMYELRVAGSKDFEMSMYALALLSLGWQNTYNKGQHTMQKLVLADDLPSLVKLEAKELGKKHKDNIINSVLDNATHLFDTHPSCRDRIAVAKRNTMEGSCRVTASAKHIFTNFPNLSQSMTRNFYSEMLESKIGQFRLLPVEEYIEYYEKNRYDFEIGYRGTTS